MSAQTRTGIDVFMNMTLEEYGAWRDIVAEMIEERAAKMENGKAN